MNDVKVPGIDGVVPSGNEISLDELRKCRRLCRRPAWQFLRDRVLSFFDPRNWQAVALMRIRINLLETIWNSLCGILLPLISYKALFGLCLLLAKEQLLLAPSPRSLLLPYLVSPWTLSIGFNGILLPILQTALQIWVLQTMRSVTLPDAYLVMGRRLELDQAHRMRDYDLYLPSPSIANSASTSTSLPSKSTPLLLFLPGANVESIAYAPPAAMLAEAGFVVVIPHTERHWRLASVSMGYNTNWAQRLQRRVQQQVLQLQSADRLSDATAHQFQWYGVAHSLGSFTWMRLDCEKLNVRRLVFWAVAPFLQEMRNLSQVSNLSILILQGGNDELLHRMSTTSLQEEFRSLLPPDAATQIHSIANGTHRGFASYQSTVLHEPELLTRTEQHRLAVRDTIQFLNQGVKEG